jgi:hypothetical protein
VSARHEGDADERNSGRVVTVLIEYPGFDRARSR